MRLSISSSLFGRVSRCAPTFACLLTGVCFLTCFCLLALTVARASDDVSLSTADSLDNRLQDIQIGEKDQFTRLALICRTPCEVSQEGEGFLISNLRETLSINIEGTSNNADLVDVAAVERGSLLTVKSDKALLRSHIDPCTIRGSAAVCIDLEFSRKAYLAQKIVRGGAKASAPKSRPIESPSPSRAAQANTANSANIASSAHQIIPSPPSIAPKQRPLRIATPRASSQKVGSQKVASQQRDPQQVAPQKVTLSTPLRNPAAPLQLTPAPASGQPSGAGAPPDSTVANSTVAGVTAGAPILTGAARSPTVLKPVETNQLLARVDFRDYAETVLDRRFDRDRCDTAQQTLDGDAWALDAMGVVGFCRASRGEFSEAEDIFKRLLTLQPDDYEALVGRALIAGVAGEASVARKFLNEALAVDPPAKVAGSIGDLIDAL